MAMTRVPSRVTTPANSLPSMNCGGAGILVFVRRDEHVWMIGALRHVEDHRYTPY
ncbi:hypothetical protein [Nonomuraea sp. NPDC005650]|uniref:hypothetical protein n=1 Tax=Nonomuraea sp. NPDC005650 TaxID=3157045 RepID=UPI0033A90D21